MTPNDQPDSMSKGGLLTAARNVLATMFDHYKARNGRMCSIEGDDGEKCWIVPNDAMGDLILAVENIPTPSSADNALREALREARAGFEAAQVLLQALSTGHPSIMVETFIERIDAALTSSPAAEAEPDDDREAIALVLENSVINFGGIAQTEIGTKAAALIRSTPTAQQATDEGEAATLIRSYFDAMQARNNCSECENEGPWEHCGPCSDRIGPLLWQG